MEYPKQILSKEFKEFKRALEKLNECAIKGDISLETFETRTRNITIKLKQLIEAITLIMTDEDIENYLFPKDEFLKFEKEVLIILEILELT